MVRYKATARFNYYRMIDMGETLELDSSEYLRLAHLVCPIPEYSEPVSTESTMDKKPNKLYKRGRRKKI